MVSYPRLSTQQQHRLPALQKPATRIPTQFSDSSHQLWLCDTIEGLMVLKLCEHETIEQSSFWQGMNTLFNINFPGSLGNIAEVYQHISNISPLVIPPFIAAAEAEFVLIKWLPGMDVSASGVNELIIRCLAKHLGKLHNQPHSQWGSLQLSEFTAKEWPLRLKTTLQVLAQQHTTLIDQAVLDDALQHIDKLSENQFVPIMPDLRWDQFLIHQEQLALVDLDAIVYGPRTLEFVLLEYLLDKSQAEGFVSEYQNYQNIPDLAEVRLPYRLLLFLMNVLGETDLEIWLNHPKRF